MGTKKETIPRWKSWPMWLAILGSLWTIASIMGIPAKAGITDETFKTVVDAVGVILMVTGIVVNPTTTGIADKKG